MIAWRRIGDSNCPNGPNIAKLFDTNYRLSSAHFRDAPGSRTHFNTSPCNAGVAWFVA